MLCVVLPLLTGALAAPFVGPAEEHVSDLAGRQSSKGPTWYKYWANDQAEVDAKDLGGGKFYLSFNEPNGGNFVIGKGYQTGFDT